MQRPSAWSRILWGTITATVATVGLAVLSFLNEKDRPWPLIVGAASFLVIHALVNAAAKQNIATRLGERYADLHRRAVQLVADLSGLGTNQPGLWMVDLYLYRSGFRWVSNWPYLVHGRELSRELSVSLLEVSDEPTEVEMDGTVHGLCYRHARSYFWFDEAVLGTYHAESGPNVKNLWHSQDQDENSKMASRYGLLCVAPIVNQLGRNCLGVLVVHVKPERHKSFEAHSAISCEEGRRDLHNACVELHGLLSR